MNSSYEKLRKLLRNRFPQLMFMEDKDECVSFFPYFLEDGSSLQFTGIVSDETAAIIAMIRCIKNNKKLISEKELSKHFATVLNKEIFIDDLISEYQAGVQLIIDINEFIISDQVFNIFINCCLDINQPDISEVQSKKIDSESQSSTFFKKFKALFKK